MERRLAAILAADVVGYSRLMVADEAGTLTVLKTHRKEIIDPKTTEYGRRLVKLMGDLNCLFPYPGIRWSSLSNIADHNGSRVKFFIRQCLDDGVANGTNDCRCLEH